MGGSGLGYRLAAGRARIVGRKPMGRSGLGPRWLGPRAHKAIKATSAVDPPPPLPPPQPQNPSPSPNLPPPLPALSKPKSPSNPVAKAPKC